MTHDPWTGIADVPPEDLRDALLEVHWAAQFIASAGQTFVEPRPDDSHRAMSWGVGLRSFVGEGFAGAYPFRLSLRPEDLTLALLDRTDEALGSLPLAGVTRAEGYEWLTAGVLTYMGPPPPAIGRPEYDLPDHPVGRGRPFSRDQFGELRTVAALYESAAALLSELTAGRSDASPVRCWPHHFDIATLLTVAPAEGEAPARTIGIGMAPSGGGYEDWYWYVNVWPYPEPSALPPLSGPGAWHTDGWTGAVLPAEVVVAAPAGERAGLVRGFAVEAIGAGMVALGGVGSG